MVIRIEAVYENGVIKPKEPLHGLSDREAITVTVERPEPPVKTPEEILALAQAAFAGLSPDQDRILREARVSRLRG